MQFWAPSRHLTRNAPEPRFHMHKTVIRLFWFSFCVLGAWAPLPAQVDSLSSPPLVVDSSMTHPDSTNLPVKVRISRNAIESPVRYSSLDTQWIDMRRKEVHLIGQARVTYQDIELEAGYIIFSFETNIVTARGITDSTGTLQQKPHFKQGSQEFSSREMRYNFRTKKGYSIENTTTEGDLHVLTQKTKFVGAASDSLNDQIYGKNAIITTCDADVPHYGIRSTKQKIIPDKSVIIGPSNLEIAGVPTPLWLPFGFFPISKSRKAGLVFSLDYDYRDDLGYGLRGIGYFTPLGPYANLSILTDIYTRGSYRVSIRSDYNKRYRYSGGGEITWTDLGREVPETGKIERDRLFKVVYNHRQDPKANPYHNISGRIQFESSAFSRLNYYDANNVLANTISSSMNYRRTWLGKPYQFTAALTQSQNLRSGQIDMTLPEASFVVQRLQPFKRKGGGAKERWYERIGMTYSANLISRLSGPDSTFFSQETLRKARPGIRQNAAINSNFNVLRYFNVVPSVTYTEVWNYNTLRRENDLMPIVKRDTIFNTDGTFFSETIDTTSYGTVSPRYVQDFQTFRNVNMGINLNTAIFGKILFSKGWLRGLRHTIKPNLSFNYTPSNNNTSWFDEYARGTTADYSDLQRYSIFEGGPFGAPSYSTGAMSLNYSLNNIFEAKYFSKADSTAKKVNLFDNIIVSGSYNFLADSLKWSSIRIGGGTNLFKRISRFDVNIQLDPYAQDATGKTINTFYWDTDRKPLRFVNATFRLTTNLTIGKLRELFGGASGREPNDDVLGLFEGFGIQHNINTVLMPMNGRDTFLITTHTLNTSGNIRITDKWMINVGNIGYDFRSERITYPSFTFIRDLHCWEMNLGWFPEIGAYTFMVKVKPSTLDFIKIPYRRNAVGNFVGFGF